MTREQPITAGVLAPQHAFVVQFAALGGGEVAGRVEHVVSGRVTNFLNEGELLGFMRHVVTGEDGEFDGRIEGRKVPQCGPYAGNLESRTFKGGQE